jgi:hypothetical protein
MRWRSPYGHNFTRIREGFLWLPRDICGEMRWLERAKWEERLWITFMGERRWMAVRWVPDTEEFKG